MDLDAAIDDMWAALDRAHDAANAHEGVDRLNALTRVMREAAKMRDTIAAARPRVVAQIRRNEELSLAALARQTVTPHDTKVTKARVQQLENEGRQGDRE